MCFQFSTEYQQRWSRCDVIGETVPDPGADRGKWPVSKSDETWRTNVKTTGRRWQEATSQWHVSDTTQLVGQISSSGSIRMVMGVIAPFSRQMRGDGPLLASFIAPSKLQPTLNCLIGENCSTFVWYAISHGLVYLIFYCLFSRLSGSSWQDGILVEYVDDVHVLGEWWVKW